MSKVKKTKTRKKVKKGGSNATIAASALAGTYFGNTMQRKYQREGQTWFSHLLFSYLDLVWYLSKTFVKAGTFVYKEAVIYSIDYFFGRDIIKVSVEDLTSEVKEKLIKAARLAAIISKDEKAMQDLSETGKISVEIMNDILVELEEPLMELTNTATDILENICLSLTAAGVDITVGVIGAALGQIPFLGAMINVIIAAGRSLNSATETVKETSTTVGKFATLLGSSPQSTLDNLTEGKERLGGVFNQINERIGAVGELKDNLKVTGKIIDTAESASAEKEGSTETPTTETPPQSGGFKARNLKYHNKISSKTRKRIMERGYKRHGRSLDK